MHIGYAAALIGTNANGELGCRYLNSVYNKVKSKCLCVLQSLL